ncbi:hypothetical protein [Kocuria marina]
MAHPNAALIPKHRLIVARLATGLMRVGSWAAASGRMTGPTTRC